MSSLSTGTKLIVIGGGIAVVGGVGWLIWKVVTKKEDSPAPKPPDRGWFGEWWHKLWGGRMDRILDSAVDAIVDLFGGAGQAGKNLGDLTPRSSGFWWAEVSLSDC